MHSKLKFLTLLFFTLPVINSVNAQDCAYCDKALKDSAVDVYSSSSLITFDETLSELFSKDYSFWSSTDRSSDNSMSIKAAYSIYKGGFNQGSSKMLSEKEFNETKEIYNTNKSLSSFEATNFYKRVASETAYRAWENCIALCVNSEGIKLSVIGSSNEDFIVKVNFAPRTPLEAAQRNLKVAVTSLNCTYKSGALKDGTTINPYDATTGVYSRTNKNSDVVFTVTVEGMGSKEYTIKADAVISLQKYYWNFGTSSPQFGPPEPVNRDYPITTVNFKDHGYGVININTLMPDKKKVAGVVYISAIIQVPAGAKKVKMHNGRGMLTASNVNHDENLPNDCTATVQIKYFWNNLTTGNLINNFEKSNVSKIELVSPDDRACPKHLEEQTIAKDIPAGTTEISIIVRLDDRHISRVFHFYLPELYVQFE